MSDPIKHECGIAFIRLLKPLDFYLEKYGTVMYGLDKLQLLMQKQRNRGQDGAGLATIKLDMPPGSRYISRKRSNSSNYLRDLFTGVFEHFEDVHPDQMQNATWLKKNKPYTGEVLLGHLRYGTHGVNTIETVHPFLRQNNWLTRNLVLAGNFNLTNVDELFNNLVKLGQSPKERSDTVTILEKLGHFLDDEVERLLHWYKQDIESNIEINALIESNLDVARVLKKSTKKFDGGYVLAGMIGHGDAFVMRDPNGIRPVFYYQDDEVVVAASERPAIQTAFDLNIGDIQEIRRGHALIVKKDGRTSEVSIIPESERQACTFERIYFSRGTDRDIYKERKKLGYNLAKPVLQAIEYDIENTVFSFVPNTAETAYYGLLNGIQDYFNSYKIKRISELAPQGELEEIERLIRMKPRAEKIVVKDAKLRTFIADEVVRGDMVSHVYDVTYGIIQNEVDTLVLIDDSIVRGTTLRDSIISICGRLRPKRIIVLSSAPQIRYPDCYGIDMSRMGEFIAFQALISLLDSHGKRYLLDEVYLECRQLEDKKKLDEVNLVAQLYDEFTAKEISERVAQLIRPKYMEIPVDVIFQSLEGLHSACPQHTGDWYFSGKYPTPGGVRIVNKAFMNYMEQKNVRAY